MSCDLEVTYASHERAIVKSSSKVADYAKHEGDDTADDEDPGWDGQTIRVLKRGQYALQLARSRL